MLYAKSEKLDAIQRYEFCATFFVQMGESVLEKTKGEYIDVKIFDKHEQTNFYMEKNFKMISMNEKVTVSN